MPVIGEAARQDLAPGDLTNKEAIGVLGGTFDPVHCGHLRLALEMAEALALDVVRMIPAAVPPHRATPVASPRARLAMLEAAISGCSRLVADPRELERCGPSYTVDTLDSLRADLPDAVLCLLLGADAFSGLATWHRWEALAERAHIGVAVRPGAALPATGPVAKLLESRRRSNPRVLRHEPAGGIFVCDIPALDVSASRIRALAAGGGSLRFLVPDRVLEIIERDGVYARAQE